MSRYIDADNLVKKAEEMLAYAKKSENEEMICMAYAIINATNFIITEDAVKVEHGEWIDSGAADELSNNRNYECSICHRKDIHAEGIDVPYCWWCGAKMDGYEQR